MSAQDTAIELELDAELSALVDGEVDPARAAELRARAEREPDVAARVAHYEQMRAAIAEHPASPLPSDLRARLAARIAAGEADAIDLERDVAFAPSPTATAGAERSAEVITLTGRRQLVRIVAAAAAAAALALYFAATRTPVGVFEPIEVGEAGSEQLAERAPSALLPEPAPGPTEAAPGPAPLIVADDREPSEMPELAPIRIEPEAVVDRFEPLPKRFETPDLVASLPQMPSLGGEPEPESAPAPAQLEASDFEVADLELAALALHLGEIEDFELIEQLELLEWMAAAERSDGASEG